jgi:hypothetical protein
VSMRTVFSSTVTFVTIGLVYIIVIGSLYR